ncbi:class I SAM-dependent methyltransferase [Bosea sp. CCNWLW174]|uniref:class I SAM-dependent methyltransferase n=1 Tax=unclassified Bosea (in: a-proteobacteria) TaxID=2653178 RepID=UPI0030152891
MSAPTDAPMTNDRQFVELTFEAVLGRKPDPAALEYGLAIVSTSGGARRYVSELLTAEETVTRRTQAKTSPQFVHPGHYYSPVCDVAELQRSRFLEAVPNRKIDGIDLRTEQQEELFLKFAAHFPAICFPENATSGHRYFTNNDFYNVGDATILASFIREFRPRRIVEVGSGFSSAVILDTLDEISADTGSQTQCTFVEPYPDRLRGLLKTGDTGRVTIHEAGVQNVDKTLFTSLQSNDILFLDTTHISKTGSDVNYEVFEILPHLAPGVIVHFHDFFHNFEYPKVWVIDDNRSWNEIYLLRAFLMFNDAYEIMFFNHHFAIERPTLANERHSGYAGHPGGGLWLRRR